MRSFQNEDVTDPVMAKYAMVAPVLEATLYSLQVSRVERLGGYEAITLHDLAREFRDGSGDAGICFEYTVHDAIASRNPLIWPLASEVLNDFCGISDGADSILFGPEKNGRIPILESVQDALTGESRLYVGNRGHPPKLRRYIPQVINAFHRREDRARLPRSITGLWKADLFIGNPGSDKWVGTTVKSHPTGLEGAAGLRVGIYPQVNASDSPRKDENLNLIRLPLPYDGGFSELYYKSFFLVRAFLKADAEVPSRALLPDAEDRYITEELKKRRQFPVLDVIDAVRSMSQETLLSTQDVEFVEASSTLAQDGLEGVGAEDVDGTAVSLSPAPHTTGGN